MPRVLLSLWLVVLAAGCGRVRFGPTDAGLDTSVPSRDAGTALDATTPLDAFVLRGADSGAVDAAATADTGDPDAGGDAGTDASRPDAGPLPSPAVVFLSHPLPATSAGEVGADAACADDARAAGLSGTFVSVVGTVGSDPFARLGAASGWVRPDGRVVALSRASLLGSPLLYPIVLRADGTFVDRALTWMGVSSDCDGWTTTMSGGSVGLASSPRRWDGRWGGSPCTAMNGVYCFQTDAAVAPSAPTPTTGRRLFVSDATATLGAMTPDALCESSRLAAGLPTRARAFVAMTGASPLSRVTLDGRPWVRMDGLVLFPGDPSGYPLLPVLYDASGALVPIGATASVGSNGPGSAGTAASTCSSWTTGGMTYDRNVGEPDMVSDGWFGAGVSQCDAMEYRFYCLED